jgi:hypothetical protein
MARKIFWGLWMTVWPAVALIPPLVTAQGPQHPVRVDDTIVTPSKRSAPPAEIAVSKPAVTVESLSEIPQLDTSAQGPFEPTVSSTTTTTRQISQPTTEPSDKAFDAEAFEKSEQLPATGKNTASQTPQTPARPRLTRRTGPELTAQEERAQKLIHERAMLRAQQRHTRLAARQGIQTMPRLTKSQSTNWRPQLTQPNALAEFDRVENP